MESIRNARWRRHKSRSKVNGSKVKGKTTFLDFPFDLSPRGTHPVDGSFDLSYWNNEQMMAKAEAKYIRIAPLKVRQVIDLVRGKRLDQALAILENTQKRSSLPVRKLLVSAYSNARFKNRQMESHQLWISDIQANHGPMMKRYKAGAMGKAMPILRRTTHIRVCLDKARG